MGTRSLICVISDGKFKIAQYARLDGYPTGVGTEVLNFIRSEENLELLRTKLGILKPISQDKAEELIASYRNEKGEMNVLAQTKFASDYPAIAQDTGSDILRLVADTEDDVVEIVLDEEFGGEGLHCEWAYVINFDNETFEVYKGHFEKFDIDKSPIKKPVSLPTVS